MLRAAESTLKTDTGRQRVEGPDRPPDRRPIVPEQSRVPSWLATGAAWSWRLLLLAIAVVVMHFVSVLTFNAVEHQLADRVRGTARLHIVYENGRGVLREVLRISGQRNWQLTELDADAHDVDDGEVRVTMTL